jgi:hypothetical protein
MTTVESAASALEISLEVRRKPVREACLRTIWHAATAGFEECKFYVDYEVTIVDEAAGAFECRMCRWLEDLLIERGFEVKLTREPARVYGFNYFYLISYSLQPDEPEVEAAIVPTVVTETVAATLPALVAASPTPSPQQAVPLCPQVVPRFGARSLNVDL